MAVLKNSLDKEEIKEQYEQLWNDFQDIEDSQVKKIIAGANFELLSARGKFLLALSPFKTHLVWIIPISVIVIFLLLYLLFLWVALWVE